MRPTLVLNPSTDVVFVRFAYSILEDGDITVTDFEQRLQHVYARAAVHSRQLSGEQIVVWYVYREGSWISSRPVRTRNGGREPDARPD